MQFWPQTRNWKQELTDCCWLHLLIIHHSISLCAITFDNCVLTCNKSYMGPAYKTAIAHFGIYLGTHPTLNVPKMTIRTWPTLDRHPSSPRNHMTNPLNTWTDQKTMGSCWKWVPFGHWVFWTLTENFPIWRTLSTPMAMCCSKFTAF